jgi:hypothetical protein
MLKKVLVGGFLLLMACALVIGGISLFGQSEHAYAQRERGQGERNVIARGADIQTAQNGQGRGRGDGGTGSDDRAAPNGVYGRGQGQGNARSLRPELQAETANWQTVEGVVVETTELVIETAGGQTVQVGLGPSHYRESQGFVLQIGDSVKVSGYVEDGEFKAGQIEKPDTGESIVLRDSFGRPMWAGQGNRKNAVSYDAQTQ